MKTPVRDGATQTEYNSIEDRGEFSGARVGDSRCQNDEGS